jgi:hypothetical protein
LDLQGPKLSGLNSSPGVLRFTAVVGAAHAATGATAQLELLPGGWPVHCLLSIQYISTVYVASTMPAMHVKPRTSCHVMARRGTKKKCFLITTNCWPSLLLLLPLLSLLLSPRFCYF